MILDSGCVLLVMAGLFWALAIGVPVPFALMAGVRGGDPVNMLSMVGQRWPRRQPCWRCRSSCGGELMTSADATRA
jgi:hypothetical protein